MNRVYEETLKLSLSIRGCPFCGNLIWICWDLSEKIPHSYYGKKEDLFVDWDIWDSGDMNGSRSAVFVDECFNCGAVAS